MSLFLFQLVTYVARSEKGADFTMVLLVLQNGRTKLMQNKTNSSEIALQMEKLTCLKLLHVCLEISHKLGKK